MELDEAFKKFTRHRKWLDNHVVECKKGLFQVTAPTLDIAEREARHYFRQYFDDGEYTEE
jgi:hypothetical protein